MEVTKKRIVQIMRKRRYGLRINGNTVYGEPTEKEITAAFVKKEPEPRGLQEDWEELVEEWKRVPLPDLANVMSQYHARRIAHLGVNGWPDEDVVKICVHDVLEDGAHRLLAAKYNCEETIDCVVVRCSKCGRV